MFTEEGSRRFFSVATFLSLQVWLDSIAEEFEVIISRASFSTKKAFLLHKEKCTWTGRNSHGCNMEPSKFHVQLRVKRILYLYNKKLFYRGKNPGEIQTSRANLILIM